MSHPRPPKPGKSLADVNPTLASSWHPTLNRSISPTDVSQSSGWKAWWLCAQCGNEWQATVANRHRNGQGCPECAKAHRSASRRRPRQGHSLADKSPTAAARWHPTKNGTLRPGDVNAGTAAIVWWQCSDCGLEYQNPVYNQAAGAGCPACGRRAAAKKRATPRRGSSLGERDSAVSSTWHPTKNGGLTPYQVNAGSPRKIWWVCQYGHEWQASVSSRVNGHGCPDCARRQPRKRRSLASLEPKRALTWHPTKNQPLTPYDVGPWSTQMVWWQCAEFAHEWRATVKNRRHHGCPYCSGHRVATGINDLASQRPLAARYWHPHKNGGLTPDSVSIGSHANVWWVCAVGHEFTMEVCAKARNQKACRICSGKEVLVGCNSLADTAPGVSVEWNYDRNSSLRPQDVTKNSGRKVWWKCAAHGHEWEAVISSRTSGMGCPVCSGKKVLAGFNDLGTTNPDVAAAWHPDKNGALLPVNVTRGSGKMVWLACQCGRSFRRTIARACTGRLRCPVCTGHKVVSGVNDFASLATASQIALWHPTKNAALRLSEVSLHSGKVVHWQCDTCTYEWRTSVAHIADGTGCPCCAGQVCVRGVNDVATVSPELAREWHPTKNDRSPRQVTAGSAYYAWWRCQAGHEWRTAVGARSKGTYGCPQCACVGSSQIERRIRSWLCPSPFTERVALADNARVPISWRSRKHMLVDVLGTVSGTSRPFVVEYDGRYWHERDGGLDRDTDKTAALLDAGYAVVRIRENGLPTVPLWHERLLQMDFCWSRSDEPLVDVIWRIEHFLHTISLLDGCVTAHDASPPSATSS